MYVVLASTEGSEQPAIDRATIGPPDIIGTFETEEEAETARDRLKEIGGPLVPWRYQVRPVLAPMEFAARHLPAQP